MGLQEATHLRLIPVWFAFLLLAMVAVLMIADPTFALVWFVADAAAVYLWMRSRGPRQ